MMNNSVLSFLSICRKAQKLKIGFDAVEKTLKDSKLIIFAQDVSPKTKERMIKKNQSFDVRHVTVPFTVEHIHISIGKPAAVLSIIDKGLADAFLKRLSSGCYENNTNNDGC